MKFYQNDSSSILIKLTHFLCVQCAHGRPTTVPLVDLKALHKQIAKLKPRQAWHGFERREITLDRAKSRLDEAKS